MVVNGEMALGLGAQAFIGRLNFNMGQRGAE